MVCARVQDVIVNQATLFQWPVKWPMVCAFENGDTVDGVVVSMACEVADGLRPDPAVTNLAKSEGFNGL